MKRRFSRIIFIIPCSLLSSCIGDCVQQKNGTVLDATTKKPIANVKVYKVGHPEIYTDSTGRFEIHEISGGLTGCPTLILNFAKDGYQFETIPVEKTDMDIYLKKDMSQKN